MSDDNFTRRLGAWAGPWIERVLLFLLFAGPPALRRRDVMASLRGEVDIAVAIQIGVWVIAPLWIGLQLLKRHQSGPRTILTVPRLPVPTLLGCLLAVLLAASAYHSPSPNLTLFRAYQVFIGCLLGYFLVNKLDVIGATRFLRRGFALVGYAVFVIFAIEPDLVLLRERYFGIRGDTVAPVHIVGVLLSILVLVWPFPEGGVPARPGTGKPFHLPKAIRMRHLGFHTGLRGMLDNRMLLAFLALAMVALCRSRIALALFIVVLGVILLTIARRWSLWAQIGCVLLITLSTVGAAASADHVVGWVARNPRQLSNFSHRLPLWDHLVTTTLDQSPVMGLGYVSATRTLGPEVVPALANAHSSFFEVLVGGGLASFVVYITIWSILLYRATISTLTGEPVGVAIGMMTLVLFGFSTTTSYPILPSPPSFLFWVLVAMAGSPSIIDAGNKELLRHRTQIRRYRALSGAPKKTNTNCEYVREGT